MKIYLSNRDFIYVLFPSIRSIKTDTYQDPDAKVYCVLQKPNIQKELELENRYRDIVMVYNSPVHGLDVCLESYTDYLEYVSSRYGMRMSRSLISATSILNEDEFFTFLKKSIFARKWNKDMIGSYEKMYNLFRVVSSSKKEFLKLYSQLCLRYSQDEIFSSMLTFITRVQNYEQQKEVLSEFYRNIIKTVRMQTSSVEMSLKLLSKMSHNIPKENKYLGFYLSLRG